MKLPLISTGMLGLCLTLSIQAEDTNNQTVKAAAKEANEAIEEVNIIGLSPYSATKSDTPVMDTPRSISIINQQAITGRGATSLADATAYSASVTANMYGYATRGDWIAIRGVSAPIYQDSLQALFSSYSNSRAPIYSVEQIEILKGPSAVLYGADSTGGIVNMVTKKPKAESKGELVMEIGSFDRQQLATDWTGSFDQDNTLLYRFVGLIRDSETQVDYVDDNAKYIAPSFTWKPSDDTSMTALLAYNETRGAAAAQFLPIKGTLQPAPNGQRLDPSVYLGEPGYDRYDTTSTSLTLLGEHRFNDTWKLQATSRYSRAHVDYQQAYMAFINDQVIPGGEIRDRYIFTPDGNLYKNGTVPRRFIKEDTSLSQWAIDIRSLAEFTTGIMTHKLILGFQHQAFNEEKEGYSALLGVTTSPPDDTYWVNVFNPVYGSIPSKHDLLPYTGRQDKKVSGTGIYVTDQLYINNLIMNAGIRYTQIHNKGSRVVFFAPSNNNQYDIKDEMLSLDASVMYEFDFGLSPYASYADGFEPVTETTEQGKPLKPKTSKQYEAGFKFQADGSQSYLTAAYFYIQQRNLFDANSEASKAKQIDKGRISGYEVEGFLPLGDFSIYSTWSKLDSEDGHGYQLASIPNQTASLWLNYQSSTFLRGFKAGFGTRYNGTSQNGTDTLETPSYTLMDAMLGYENDHVDITLNINNLAGKTYIATCLARGDCFYGLERNAILRVAAKF